MKKLIIISGSSNGLGKHLTVKYLNDNHTVIGISRSNTFKNGNFYFFKFDLSKGSKVISSFETFLTKNKINKKYEEVVLINNAATILPINFFHKIKLSQIEESYQLNLHSPLLLTHFVINKFINKSKQILICNISSGAAIRPIINWSMYCTMKSGLKMFTDCINTDYSQSKKVKAFSFSPGVMDTKMQETIRNQSSNKFKKVDIFKELKKEDKLLSPDSVAAALYLLLQSSNRINQNEYNINDLI